MRNSDVDYLLISLWRVGEEVGVDNYELNLLINNKRIDELTAVIIDKIRILKAARVDSSTPNCNETLKHRAINEALGWIVYELNIPDALIVDSLDAPLFIHTLENWSSDANMARL